MAKRKYVKRKEAYEQFGVSVRMGILSASNAVAEAYVAQELGRSRPSPRINEAIERIDEAIEYLTTARKLVEPLKEKR